MDLDNKPYRCFLAVAYHRSFRRAAEMLNMTQPALSGRIAELERRVGFSLFERGNRPVALTTEGALLLQSAERLVRENEIMNTAIRNVRDSQMRMATPMFTTLISARNRLLAAFELAHPDIAYQVINGTPTDCLHQLAEVKVDLALNVTMLPQYYRKGAKPRALAEVSTNFEFQVLAEKEIRLGVPADHPLAQTDVIPLAALRGAKIFVPGKYHGRAIGSVLKERLEAAEIEPLFAPEGNVIGLQQHAARHRALVLRLGWFDDVVPTEVAMVTRSLEGLNLSTALTLLRNSRPLRRGAEAFWAVAQSLKQNSQ